MITADSKGCLERTKALLLGQNEFCVKRLKTLEKTIRSLWKHSGQCIQIQHKEEKGLALIAPWYVFHVPFIFFDIHTYLLHAS